MINSQNFISTTRKPIYYLKKGKKVICKIEGVNDIDTAKQYVGSEIFVDKEELPKLKEGQYYYNDLLGLMLELKTKKLARLLMFRIMVLAIT